MDVVLCWHMHQPDYRLDGRYLKPWTWLHAIKDYSDMAAHLESVPGARAVVNFSPVLIEQLLDYPQRIRTSLAEGGPVGDLVLNALVAEHPQPDPGLIAQLLRVNEERMKDRFAPYARLFDRARLAGAKMEPGEVPDLLVWYVIAWLGESLRAQPLVQSLAGRESGFTFDDRREFCALLADVIEGILPRYRTLAEQDRVELSVTPHSHPILPLLLDFQSARDAMPQVALPAEPYPGGAARCDWHLNEARRLFREVFDREPAGCWPSEGAVSRATIALLGKHGFSWTASGSQVLHNTLQRAGVDWPGVPHLNAWRSGEEHAPACFFRDDGLSDMIGFEYSKWPAGDAVHDFVSRLERLREDHLAAGGAPPVLSIIMDGENAWEYYPNNGWEFLHDLYTQLSSHQTLRLKTFSEALDGRETPAIPELCAGSWVHGSLSTWIGDPAKNRAWDLLGMAKRAVDAALEPHDAGDRAEWVDAVSRQLAICEASDWSWWLGEDNALQDSPEFDALFRRHLGELYRLLELEPPEVLNQSISGWHQHAEPVADETLGAMRRSGDAI